MSPLLIGAGSFLLWLALEKRLTVYQALMLKPAAKP